MKLDTARSVYCILSFLVYFRACTTMQIREKKTWNNRTLRNYRANQNDLMIIVNLTRSSASCSAAMTSLFKSHSGAKVVCRKFEKIRQLKRRDIHEPAPMTGMTEHSGGRRF